MTAPGHVCDHAPCAIVPMHDHGRIAGELTHLITAVLRCHAGYKGTFVCEPDKAKALDMYKAWKAGVKFEAAPAHH